MPWLLDGSRPESSPRPWTNTRRGLSNAGKYLASVVQRGEQIGKLFRCGKNLASLPDADKTWRLSPKREELAELCPARENAPSLSAPKNSPSLYPRRINSSSCFPAPGKLAEFAPRREDSPSCSRAGKTHRNWPTPESQLIKTSKLPAGRPHRAVFIFLHPSCLCRHRARGDAPPKIINQSKITHYSTASSLLITNILSLGNK